MTISRIRYSVVAICLHWIIALLIAGNIAIAWYSRTLHGAAMVSPLQLHKSIGITVLLLSLIRLAWRLIASPPSLPRDMPEWEIIAAQIVHALFYVIMIGMPLSGWAMSSASPLIRTYPMTLFNLIPWPPIGLIAHLPAGQLKQLHDIFKVAHHLLAKLAYALIILHVGGATKHLLISRDGVVFRMMPLPFAAVREKSE